MDQKTSGVGGSDEFIGSDVTAVETVTVCYFNRKNSDQTPKCTVKTRVLNEDPAKSDSEHPVETDPPAAKVGRELKRSAQSDEQTCHLPSKELTRDDAEAAAIDCMEKAQAKKDRVAPTGKK